MINNIFIGRESYFIEKYEAELQKNGLTVSELRVLQAVVEVGGVPAVAETLGISVATVKTHLAHVFAKLGVPTRTALVSEVLQRAAP